MQFLSSWGIYPCLIMTEKNFDRNSSRTGAARRRWFEESWLPSCLLVLSLSKASHTVSGTIDILAVQLESCRKEKDATSSSIELRTLLSLLRKLLVISCMFVNPSTMEDCERLAVLERLTLFISCQKTRLCLPVKAELIFLLTMCSFRRFRDLTAYL